MTYQVEFEGYGLVSFHVDDATELIRIFDNAWIG